MCIDDDWFIFLLVICMRWVLLKYYCMEEWPEEFVKTKISGLPLTDSDLGSLSLYLIIISNKHQANANVAGTSLY